MNTTVRYENAAFKARHLDIVQPERFPKKILGAIQDNYAISEFINEKPQSEIGICNRARKFIRNLFGKAQPEKDEILEVNYNSMWNSVKNDLPNPDPFDKTVSVSFQLKHAGEIFENRPSFEVSYTQKGTPKTAHSNKFNSTYTYYDEPHVKADDIILRKIERLENLNSHFAKSSKLYEPHNIHRIEM